MDTINNIRSILDIVLSLGGLAMGMVLSIINAAILFGFMVLNVSSNSIILAWIMMAFVFAAGFGTAKKQLEEHEEALAAP